MSQSSVDNDKGTPLEIRQHAYDLLTRMGGPSEKEDKSEWPQSPPEVAKMQSYQQQQESSYQHQTSGEGSSGRRFPDSHYGSARIADSSTSGSFVEVFVHCVSDACKVASSEILSQQGAILKTGYESFKSAVSSGPGAGGGGRFPSSSVRTYEPVTGSYHSVAMPSHGYQGRYSDNPNEASR